MEDALDVPIGDGLGLVTMYVTPATMASTTTAATTIQIHALDLCGCGGTGCAQYPGAYAPPTPGAGLAYG